MAVGATATLACGNWPIGAWRRGQSANKEETWRYPKHLRPRPRRPSPAARFMIGSWPCHGRWTGLTKRCCARCGTRARKWNWAAIFRVGGGILRLHAGNHAQHGAHHPHGGQRVDQREWRRRGGGDLRHCPCHQPNRRGRSGRIRGRALPRPLRTDRRHLEVHPPHVRSRLADRAAEHRPARRPRRHVRRPNPARNPPSRRSGPMGSGSRCSSPRFNPSQ